MNDKETPRRYHPLSNARVAEMPGEDPEVGPWHCMADKRSREEESSFDFSEFVEVFIEVHQSSRGDGVVIRNSEYNNSRIKLGGCSILTKAQAIQVRDRLTELIGALKDVDG